ncbi:MAG: DUF2358 domain-containing protein [Fischerella sp.]|nr:DUF2358 domain-containing protein [Fischerella sp.]
MDERSQVELVIETLKQDLPTLFEKDISYDIYTQDIYFRDPVNKFKGKTNYRIIFWTLRFHARLFFTQIYFDLHDVYQSADLKYPIKMSFFNTRAIVSNTHLPITISFCASNYNFTLRLIHKFDGITQ